MQHGVMGGVAMSTTRFRRALFDQMIVGEAVQAVFMKFRHSLALLGRQRFKTVTLF